MTSVELNRLLQDYKRRFASKYQQLVNDLNFYYGPNANGPKSVKKSPQKIKENFEDYALFKLWMEKYKEKHEFDFYLKKSNRFVADEIRTPYQSIKDFFFFDYNDWPHLFSFEFIKNVELIETKNIPNLYSVMSLLTAGYFSRVKGFKLEIVKTDTPFCLILIAPFCNFFLSCMIGLKKVPNFDNYTGHIYSVKYTHYIFFLGISGNRNAAVKSAMKYKNEYFPVHFVEELEAYLSSYLINRNSYFFSKSSIFDCSQDKSGGIVYHTAKIDKNSNLKQYSENKFPYIYMSSCGIRAQMIFEPETGIWCLDPVSSSNNTTQKFNKFKMEKFAQYFQANAQFKKAVQLVEFLEKIPNFALKLTKQEKSVIGQQGNVLVLGRSGTGKTTCLLLRLFAMEFLFRLRMRQVKQKFETLYGEIQPENFVSQDIDKSDGLHTVFVTASPVLCEEVRNFYLKLKNHVKIEMMKKEEAQTKKKAAEIMGEDEAIEDLSFEDLDEEKGPETEKVKIKIDKNENLMEKKYDILNEKALMREKKTQKYDCISQIPENEFPCFFNIRQFIYMIDSELRYPYLIRNHLNRIVGFNLESREKNFDITEYYESKKKKTENNSENISDYGLQLQKNESEEFDNLDENYLYEIKKFERLNEKKKETSYSYIEIDYEAFQKQFWSNEIKKKKNYKNVTCNLAWTQIYSVIKGSKANTLREYEYNQMSLEKNLSPHQKKIIFQIYWEYEYWKRRKGAFDLMDIVGHILRQMDYGNFYMAKTIHYLMVDEVQDLPHSILILLSKIATYGLFFSGDTAQNIAKGVGFRFCDLRHVFDSKIPGIQKPVVKQLSINFRSHQNILNLGNSVVALLELIFPSRIDHLRKERSSLIGPKPFLISVSPERSSDIIFHLLNETQFEKNKSGKNIFVRPNIEFGCNQVILVRNEDSKAHIPPLLGGALCLTVFEAKGLEFDDVILFNFFTDFNVNEDENWEVILKLIGVENVKIKDPKCNDEDMEIVDNLDALDAEIIANKQEIYSADITVFNSQKCNDFIEFQKITAQPKLKSMGIEKYGVLCNELKELYTAITRARKKLIIYDQNPEKGKKIKQIWKTLNIVETFSDEDFEFDENHNEKSKKLQDLMKVTNKEEWRKQGIKFFNHKNFEQAMKCFEKAGEELLFARAKLNFQFIVQSKELEEIEEKKYFLMKKKRNLILYENQKALKELKAKEIQIRENFNIIAEQYLKQNLKLEACECYLRSKHLESAAEIYIAMEMWSEAGEMYYLMGNYEKSANCYEKINDYIKIMECYENEGNFEAILLTIDKFRSIISKEDRLLYLKKYFPVVLEKLISNVDFEEPEVPNHNNRKTNAKEIEAIQEEAYESDEFLSSSSESDIEEEEKVSSEIEKNEQNKYPNLIETSMISKNNNNTSVMDNLSFMDHEKHEESYDKILKADKKDMSFEQVGFEAHIKEKSINDEHLSQIDFDDEWLKSEKNYSVISAILSSREKKIEVKSEYSGLDSINPNSINPNYHIIKTKGDIFVQDDTMKKIVQYIKIFSEDFYSHLEDFRSKHVLLSTMGKQQNEDSNENFVMDLDNIDANFLMMILDVLETYDHFKLCIFVCNRYTLHQKVGRYLISIAHKYSFIAQEMPAYFSFSLFSSYKFIKNQQEKAFITSTAIHNVLENINPHYLKFKNKNEEVNNCNDLGIETFQGLILLGCWKKCVYFMDYDNSLALTASCADYLNFKYLFLRGHPEYCKFIIENNPFCLKNYERIPFNKINDDYEFEYLKICLQEIIYQNNCLYEKLEQVFEQKTTEEFSQYFEYNLAFQEFLLNKKDQREIFIEKLNEAAILLRKILEKKGELIFSEKIKIFDCVSTIIQFILFLDHDNNANFQLENTSFILECVDMLLNFVSLLENFKNSKNQRFIILEAIFSPFKITFIKKSKILDIYGKQHVLIKRDSMMFIQILKNFPKTHEISKNLLPFDIDYEIYLLSREIACIFVINSIKKSIKKLLFTKVNPEHLEYINLNKYILAADIDKERMMTSVLGLAAIFKKINEIDNKNKNKPDYVPILKQSSEKKENIEPLKKKKLTKYDERKFSPDVLLKIEYEENEISERLNFLSSLSKSKDGKPLTKTDFFFKIFKHFYKLDPRKIKLQSVLTLIEGYIIKTHFEYINNAKKIYNDDICQGFKLYLKAYNMLEMIGLEALLLEEIKKCKKESVISNLGFLIDANIFIQNGCIEEYCENIFSYLAKTFKVSPLHDKLAKIEQVIIKILLAKNNPKSKTQEIKLPKSLMKYLNQPIITTNDNNSSVKSLKIKMNPLSREKFQETVYECLYWLKKIAAILVQDSYNEQLISKRIFNLLIVLVLNTTEFNNEAFNEVKDIIDIISRFSDFYEKSYNTWVFEKLFDPHLTLTELTNLKTEFVIFKENGEKTLFYKSFNGETNEDFIQIFEIIPSTPSETERNYEDSDKMWYKQYLWLSQRLIAKNKIIKAFKNTILDFRKNCKKRNLPGEIAFNIMHLHEENHEKINEKDLQIFLLRNRFILKIYEKLARLSHLILHTYYLNMIDKGLDFHYILSCLNEVVMKREQFENSIILQSNSEIISNESTQTFIDLGYEIGNMIESFEKWIGNHHTPKRNEIKLNENKKLIALKFARRKLYRSANKIYNLRKNIVK